MSGALEPIDPRVARDLADPGAYPVEADGADTPEHVQTHLSHVFLTRSRVYKLRKAVRFDFVDFGTRQARDLDCLREVRLNRRLAPEVYMGVAPVWIEAGRARVGSAGEDLAAAAPDGSPVLEHCVVMVRLPAGCDALSLLEQDALSVSQLDRLAAQVARFHAEHRLPRTGSAGEWRAHVEAPGRENFEVLRSQALSARERERLARVEQRTGEGIARHAARLEARYAAGLAVDGHGDLHLQHVWYLPGSDEARVIDCVEFRDAFRELDPAAEVAFLAMDLAYRARPDLAERFLCTYAECADDHALFALVDFFVAYRALVRAKVAALATRDPELDTGQRASAAHSVTAHLELAERALEPRRPGEVFALCGPIGTGKSTVARTIGEALGACVIASDRVRKRLAGVEALERTREGFGEGIFGGQMSDATYAGLLERAEPLALSGRPVVLDATYASRKRRDALQEWAQRHGFAVTLVRVSCDPEVTRARLIERRRRDDDASDAGPEHQAASLNRYSPPDEWPAQRRIEIRTDAPDWRAKLVRELDRMRAPAPGGRSENGGRA